MSAARGITTLAIVGAVAFVGYVVYKKIEEQKCASDIYALIHPSECKNCSSDIYRLIYAANCPTTTTPPGGTTTPCDYSKGIYTNCYGPGNTQQSCWKSDDCRVTKTGQALICAGATATSQGTCLDCNLSVVLYPSIYEPAMITECAYRIGQCVGGGCTPTTPETVEEFCTKQINNAASVVQATRSRDTQQKSGAQYVSTVCHHGTNANGTLYGGASISWKSPTGWTFNTDITYGGGLLYGDTPVIGDTPLEYCSKYGIDPASLGLTPPTCAFWDLSCKIPGRTTGDNYCKC